MTILLVSASSLLVIGPILGAKTAEARLVQLAAVVLLASAAFFLAAREGAPGTPAPHGLELATR